MAYSQRDGDQTDVILMELEKLQSQSKVSQLLLLRIDLLTQLLENIAQYINGELVLTDRKPRLEIENYEEYETVFSKFLKEDSGFVPNHIVDLLSKLELQELLVLLGQRITPASIRDERAVPPRYDDLIASANSMYNDRLSHAARARAKHGFRCRERYWGEIRGPPDAQNTESQSIIEHMLQNHSWWNVFGHFKHERVYEIRDKTGHGCRWDIDTMEFIGFVEPSDIGSGLEFEQ